MTENLTLYWNVVSQPARAVKTLLDIGKINCKFVNIDLFKLEQKKPQYLSINPMGTVPTLVHGNLKITESIAILTYLCDQYPSILASYYGSTPEERSQVHQYLSWCQAFLRPNLGALFFLQKQVGLRQRKMLPAQSVALAESNMQLALKTLNDLIGDKDYLANERPTIADIMIYFEVTILAYHSKDHTKYKNIERWFKNIYRIAEVKMMTHQWFAVAQQMAKLLSQIPIKQASL